MVLVVADNGPHIDFHQQTWNGKGAHAYHHGNRFVSCGEEVPHVLIGRIGINIGEIDDENLNLNDIFAGCACGLKGEVYVFPC